MKTYILRVVALLILASATLPNCSVEYQERHGRGHENGNGRGHDHDHDGDHHYRNN